LKIRPAVTRNLRVPRNLKSLHSTAGRWKRFR